MKLSRKAIGLLVCSVLVWVGMVANIFAIGAIGWIGCAIFAFLEAGKKGRSTIGWTLGMLVFPYFLAPVLAFIPAQSLDKGGVYVTGSFLGNRLSVEGSTLKVRQFGFPMDKLRYVFVIMPGKYWTVLVHSSQTSSCIDMDLFPDAEYAMLATQLTAAAREGGLLDGLGEIKFCLADFGGNFGQFSLRDVKHSGIDVLGELGKYRQARLAARREWFKTGPQIVLRGNIWGQAVLNKEGYHRGKQLVAWDKVGTVQVQTMNGIAAHFYVIPEGVSSGSYSFAKGKYGMPIAISRSDIYTCEANFWRVNARNNFAQA